MSSDHHVVESGLKFKFQSGSAPLHNHVACACPVHIPPVIRTDMIIFANIATLLSLFFFEGIDFSAGDGCTLGGHPRIVVRSSPVATFVSQSLAQSGSPCPALASTSTYRWIRNLRFMTRRQEVSGSALDPGWW